MKKTIVLLVLFWMLFPQFLMAQEKYIDQIKIEDVRVTRDGNSVALDMNIILDGLKMRSNDVMLLSPALRNRADGEILKMLPPVQVAGKKRSIVLERMASSGISREWNVDPKMEFTRKNNTPQLITYSHRMANEQWMSDTELIFVEVAHGCADCFIHEGAKVILEQFMPDKYVPNYKLTYITPQVEPIKARSDRHTASFSFVVDRHELRRDYKNNATEFDRVDKVVSEVVKNKDLTITEFSVIGYASPEATFEYNKQLAGRRANAFADYLIATHGVRHNQFKVVGHGEDWEGLTQAVRNSSLSTKSEVLSIIDKTGNPDARDAKIKAIDNGETYNILLNQYYPALRRTDYVIAYTVRAFDVEEAKAVIKTNPKHLSLNEMYLVAQSYPAGSKEFMEVFDIATRLYPNEPVAMINGSAVDVEGGNYQAAIDRLTRIQDRPEALNNLGVAYAKAEQWEKAQECFEKAIANGDEAAKHNMEELNKVEKE